MAAAQTALWIIYQQGLPYQSCCFVNPLDPKNSMLQTLWSYCLSRLQDELPNQQFNTWIRPLQVEYFNEQVSLDSIGAFAVGVGPTPRSNAHPDAKMSTGIRITAQGMRYAGGAVYRF